MLKGKTIADCRNMLNIFLQQWNKVLDLSTKHQSNVDTVQASRLKYLALARCDKKENNKKYIQ